jgi:general secretion pathway protein F
VGPGSAPSRHHLGVNGGVFIGHGRQGEITADHLLRAGSETSPEAGIPQQPENSVVGKLETARFTRTLGTLLNNGVPLLSALSIGTRVVGNSVLRSDIEDASKQVKTGGGLARNLSTTGRFPRLALQMVSVGEETGQLDRMLLKVADTYDREVRNTIDRLLSVFTPVVTLLLAVMIGTIVLSVLLAILSINDLVG